MYYINKKTRVDILVHCITTIYLPRLPDRSTPWMHNNFLLHYYLFKFLDNLASVYVAAYSSNVPWKAKTQ